VTIHNIYVGDLADPNFHWEGGDWNGNVPRPLGPSFPGAGFGMYCRVMDAARSGRYDGKQTDFGGWVLKVRRQQILDLIEEWYGHDPWYTDPAKMPHLFQQLQDLRAFVLSLDPEATYALVAWEL
jgi:hypothetical protein